MEGKQPVEHMPAIVEEEATVVEEETVVGEEEVADNYLVDSPPVEAAAGEVEVDDDYFVDSPPVEAAVGEVEVDEKKELLVYTRRKRTTRTTNNHQLPQPEANCEETTNNQEKRIVKKPLIVYTRRNRTVCKDVMLPLLYRIPLAVMTPQQWQEREERQQAEEERVRAPTKRRPRRHSRKEPGSTSKNPINL